MKTKIVSEDGTTRNMSIYTKSGIDLLKMFDVFSVEFDPFTCHKPVSCKLILDVSMIALDIGSVETGFENANGTIGDLDEIIEELQKLRTKLTKEG
jgi:hypothetical protein